MNIVEKEWQRVLANELNNNLFMDSPKGKSAFACGIAFVLRQWENPNAATRTQLYSDLKAFVDSYMEASR